MFFYHVYRLKIVLYFDLRVKSESYSRSMLREDLEVEANIDEGSYYSHDHSDSEKREMT